MRKLFPEKKLILIFFLLASISTLFLYSDEIKIKTENGVTVVYNPRKPAPSPGIPTQLTLKEDLTIGTKEGEKEFLFYELIDLAVDDDGNVYALDQRECHIKVFNSKGELIRTIGKKGQGPGEMQGPRNISMTPQKEIMVNDRATNHLLFFNPDGTFVRAASAEKMWILSDPKIDSEGNITSAVISIKNQGAVAELKKFNSKLKVLLTLSSIEFQRFPSFNPFFPLFFWEVTEDNHIVYGFQSKYELHVLNPKGKPVKKIFKEYDPIKISKEEKEKRLKLMFDDNPYAPEVKIDWPKHHNAFMYLTIDEEGRIFTRTYEKTKDGKSYYYDVFDSEGRCIAKTPLPDLPYVWKKNKMYTIHEDEEGYKFVKRYAVKWE